MRLPAAALLAAGAAAAPAGAAPPFPALVPRPAEVAPAEGAFELRRGTAIVATGDAANEADALALWLRPALGENPPRVDAAAPRDGAIALILEPAAPGAGIEGYRLDVTRNRVVVRAPRPAGLFYGCQTLRQLLPTDICAERPAADARWRIPCVTIADRPRFAWRGLLLDTARHFMPEDYIRKLIAAMAAHKLNTLQLHLTDDQGWRVEIKKYPRLTGVGAWRDETLVGHARDLPQRFDGRRHGGFYSQDDIRALVDFARRHHVNIVPEIEMPGHAGAALAAYPELGCFPERAVKVWTRWGISPDIFDPGERTVAFLQDVLREVMSLFPSPFIHVGGDEAVKDHWKRSPGVQARMRALGLRDEEELQGWFIRQMDGFLAAHGRRLIGWDEILQGGLAPGAAVMSWRGAKGGIAAARAGHDVVMAPNTHAYFDYYQGPKESEPLAIGGFLPIEKVLAFNPVPADLAADEARRILGAQAQLWTEYVPAPAHADYMIWPRAAALAEIVWTGGPPENPAEFMGRLRRHLPRLDAMAVPYRPLD